jgi:hypothetical protein
VDICLPVLSILGKGKEKEKEKEKKVYAIDKSTLIKRD